MTTHPAELVKRTADVLSNLPVGVGDFDAAQAVLDAFVVQAPLAKTEHDGRIRLAWPAGVDPDRDPALGAQLVAIDARLLARLVEERNAAAGAVRQALDAMRGHVGLLEPWMALQGISPLTYATTHRQGATEQPVAAPGSPEQAAPRVPGPQNPEASVNTGCGAPECPCSAPGYPEAGPGAGRLCPTCEAS